MLGSLFSTPYKAPDFTLWSLFSTLHKVPDFALWSLFSTPYKVPNFMLGSLFSTPYKAPDFTLWTLFSAPNRVQDHSFESVLYSDLNVMFNSVIRECTFKCFSVGVSWCKLYNLLPSSFLISCSSAFITDQNVDAKMNVHMCACEWGTNRMNLKFWRRLCRIF